MLGSLFLVRFTQCIHEGLEPRTCNERLRLTLFLFLATIALCFLSIGKIQILCFCSFPAITVYANVKRQKKKRFRDREKNFQLATSLIQK